jgi:membrane fusion protein (multidrug efflux system)
MCPAIPSYLNEFMHDYPDKMRRCIATLIVCLLVACTSPEQDTGGGPMNRDGPVAVNAAIVAAQPFVDRFTALGTARANEAIEVKSRIPSVISRINFSEGQQISAGELLVELENKEIEAQLIMAQAGLKQKRSQYERSKTLGETQAVSESELEKLEADLFMADAETRGAQARLNNSFIRAPFSGTVGLRRVSLGDQVGPETIITTLDDMAIMKLEFTIPETFLSSVERGMTIRANSDVYPNEHFTGTVSNIDSRVDPVTRSVTVIAKIPNADNRLRPGMFLTVSLEKERVDVLMIPEQALVPRQGRQYVFVIEEGRAVEKQVELGVRTPGLAEIRTGLDAGEMVITEGTQKVRNGAPVRVVSNT